VLFSAIVQNLTRALNAPRISVLDYGSAPDVWHEVVDGKQVNIDLINLRFSWRVYLPNNAFRIFGLLVLCKLVPLSGVRSALIGGNPWVKQILASKVNLSIAGGDSFSDIYGLRRFIYVALPQILVLLLGKPLVLLPQTYGPLKGRCSRMIARFIFRRATLIFSRDEAGCKVITDLAPGNIIPVKVMPDIGFSMEPSPVPDEVLARLSDFRQKEILIGLNVSKLLFMGGYSSKNMFGLYTDYPVLVRSVVDFCINSLKARILLVPHVAGGLESDESEETLCRELFKELEPKYPGQILYCDDHLDHRQTKSLIGQCDLFIGARMHACVAAVSQCVPTVALAYSQKFKGVMDLVGSGVRVLDLRQEDSQSLCSGLREAIDLKSQWRADLKRKMPSITSAICGLFQSELLDVPSNR